VFLAKVKERTYWQGWVAKRRAILAAQKEERDLKTKQANENIKKETVKSSEAISPERAQEFGKILLDDFQKGLKAQGALTSEILKQTDIFIEQNNIYESNIDKIKRQLELQRALSEEKRLQTRLGSDSLKLFDVSQKGPKGIETAKEVSRVLSGETELRQFMNNASKEAITAFTTNWADLWKDAQAQAFFKGESPLIPDNRSLLPWGQETSGTGISIQEEFIRKSAEQPENIFLQKYDEIMRPHLTNITDNTSAIRELTDALRNINKTPQNINKTPQTISTPTSKGSWSIFSREEWVKNISTPGTYSRKEWVKNISTPGTPENNALNTATVGVDGGSL